MMLIIILLSLVTFCLNDNLNERPPIKNVSIEINQIKDACNQQNETSSMIWWVEVSGQLSSDQQQVCYMINRST